MRPPVVGGRVEPMGNDSYLYAIVSAPAESYRTAKGVSTFAFSPSSAYYFDSTDQLTPLWVCSHTFKAFLFTENFLSSMLR